MAFQRPRTWLLTCIAAIFVMFARTDAAWRGFGGDPAHTFRSPIIGPATSIVYPKWVYYIGSDIWSSPCVTSNGMVIVGDDNGIVWAMNPLGMVAWSIYVGNVILSSPILSSDESLGTKCI